MDVLGCRLIYRFGGSIYFEEKKNSNQYEHVSCS